MKKDVDLRGELYFHSFHLIIVKSCHCLIWKRPTKDLKNQYAATLMSLIFFWTLALNFPESLFLGVAPAIPTFLDMFPMKSVNPLTLICKRACKLVYNG